MGRLSRRKGHDEERAVVRCMRDLGFEAARVLNEPRDGNCGDVLAPPFRIQVKVGKAPSPWAAVQEAADAARGGELGVAVVRRDRGSAVVVMYWPEFARLAIALAERD